MESASHSHSIFYQLSSAFISSVFFSRANDVELLSPHQTQMFPRLQCYYRFYLLYLRMYFKGT